MISSVQLKRFKSLILREYLYLDDNGNLQIRKEDKIKELLTHKFDESEAANYIDQHVKGFNRKMPATIHTITCKVCKQSTEVTAIGTRQPRQICYNTECIKAQNRANVKQSRLKSNTTKSPTTDSQENM